MLAEKFWIAWGNPLITMFRDIPESDWKKFWLIHQSALQRFSQGRLSALQKLAVAEGKNPQERLIDVFEFARQTQREMARMFDNPKRSTALMLLAQMHAEQLVEAEEWNGLSEEIREMVEVMIVG
ncbi:hypothetical protein [Verrucomicrobium spinosum]|uniref:hypothetical protein n=2 Tax=Verrucomicrobium spinosum TaxID=2736 RepID=UPI000B216CD3|nr:hypothetical protein [Verrucomicrobium spinosum]